MSLELRKRIIIQDGGGKITYDSGDVPSHSFVRQFLDMMQVIWGNVTSPVGITKTTTGIKYTMAADTHWDKADYPFSIDNDLDDENWGILLGDDDSIPEANDNFRMDSVITSGAGVGQLNYGATSWDTGVTVDGNECRWGFTRSMTNNSGRDVVVKEIGAYVRINQFPLHYALIMRDVLSPAITIPDTETIIVTYTIKTSS